MLGSGFVALQAAWAARCRGLEVTVVELEERIMPRVLDGPAARLLHESAEAHGVAVHVGVRTEGIEREGDDAVRVHVASLDCLTVDLVVVATGVRPNDGLLPEAVEQGAPGIAVSRDHGDRRGGHVRRRRRDAWPHGRRRPARDPRPVAHGSRAGQRSPAPTSPAPALAYGGSLSMNVTEMFGLTVASLGRFVERAGDDVLV